MIDEILEARIDFIREKNRNPKVIHLNEGQLHELMYEMEGMMFADIKSDKKTIFDMTIIEDGTGDISISD